MDLSIIIVEYHSIDEIRNSILSIVSNVEGCEIIVSSNSCYTEEERARIPFIADNVKWVFNSRNGGFAYAMNEGLKVAKGDFLVIMNPDCVLTSGIVGMLDFMKKHPEVGAIAPQMKDADGNIQDTARPYVSLPRFVKRQAIRVVGKKVSILNPEMDYTRVQTVDWIIGAFIMVSRKAYETTGGLDDRYFMYAEDLDWCTRIRQKGFEIVYYPRITIIYKGTRRARSRMKYAVIFLKSHFIYWCTFGFCFGYPRRQKLFFD